MSNTNGMDVNVRYVAEFAMQSIIGRVVNVRYAIEDAMSSTTGVKIADDVTVARTYDQFTILGKGTGAQSAPSRWYMITI